MPKENNRRDPSLSLSNLLEFATTKGSDKAKISEYLSSPFDDNNDKSKSKTEDWFIWRTKLKTLNNSKCLKP